MNSLTWQRGKNMKRLLEDHEYTLTIDNLAVLMILVANEQKENLEDVVKALIQANDFTTTKLDKNKSLKELGY